MIKLLEEIDDLLAYLEDTAHGEEGKRITEMRYLILTELSNSHKHDVMQAEGSDVSEGAAVGQRSVGTNAEVRGCETCKHLEDYESYPCSKCDEDYSMWEAPSGGHL